MSRVRIRTGAPERAANSIQRGGQARRSSSERGYPIPRYRRGPLYGRVLRFAFG